MRRKLRRIKAAGPPPDDNNLGYASLSVHPEPNDPRILWESSRLTAHRLTVGNEAVLQGIFVSAGDYFERLGGRPEPEPDAAERELKACATVSGRDVAMLVGSKSGEPLGALGWWCDNPEPNVALLGMLLIVPAHRGEGLAREALDGLERWLAAQGIVRLRTAVAAANFREHKLLRALGFVDLSIREHTLLGLGGAHLALFEKSITR